MKSIDEVIEMVFTHGREAGQDEKVLARTAAEIRGLYQDGIRLGDSEEEAMLRVYQAIFRAADLNNLRPQDGEHRGIR